jgi:hypothetical protein
MADYKNIEKIGSSNPSGSNTSSISISSSKPIGESSMITSSSVGYKPAEATAPTSEATKTIEPTVDPATVDKSIKDTYSDVQKTVVTKADEVQAAKMFKNLMQTKLNNFKAQDFLAGNLLFYRYDAKFKENTYDKTPLVMVLRRSKGYMLGLNFHWIPVPLRLTLMKLILMINKDNIKRGNPIHVSYQMLKPFILKMGLVPVIRLYIFSRISRRGVVVPTEYWLQSAKLRSESFSGGYSAEKLYSMAVKKFRSSKNSRTRRDHMWK